MKPPKLPTYDPAKDGNPFDWIIRQASALHRQQAEERRRRPQFDYLTGRPVGSVCEIVQTAVKPRA